MKKIEIPLEVFEKSDALIRTLMENIGGIAPGKHATFFEDLNDYLVFAAKLKEDLEAGEEVLEEEFEDVWATWVEGVPLVEEPTTWKSYDQAKKIAEKGRDGKTYLMHSKRTPWKKIDHTVIEEGGEA